MYRFAIHDPRFLPHAGCELELELEASSLTLLVGENGVGKTSILRYLERQLPGQVVMIEQQSPDFFFDRSLGKIKAIYSGNQDIDNSLFNELWKSFQLHKKEERLLSSLSGGESQALKICLGLSVQSTLYFLDEPSQYLDETAKSALQDALQLHLERKASLLMVEHDLAWIKTRSIVQSIITDQKTVKAGRQWTI